MKSGKGLITKTEKEWSEYLGKTEQRAVSGRPGEESEPGGTERAQVRSVLRSVHCTWHQGP